MTREQFEQWKNLQLDIQMEAEKLLNRYSEIVDSYNDYPGVSHNYVTFLRCNLVDELLEFEGDEYWAYGGHQHHYLEFPISHLFSNDWEDDLHKECQQLGLDEKARQKRWKERQIEEAKQILRELEDDKNLYD